MAYHQRNLILTTMNLDSIYKWSDSLAGIVARSLLSLGILALLLWKIDIFQVIPVILDGSSFLILIAIIIFALNRILVSLQLLIGLIPLKIHIPLLKLIKIHLISEFYAMSLPGHSIAGGAALWIGLSKTKSKRAQIGALVLYLKIIGMLSLLVIGTTGILLAPSNIKTFEAPFFTIFLITTVLCTFVFVPRCVRLFSYIIGLFFCIFPNEHWLQKKVKKILKAVNDFGHIDWKYIVYIVGISICTHILGSYMYYILALALDIHVSFFTIAWIRSLLLIISIAPITVAGIGVREATFVILLQQYGVPEENALGLSLAVFGVMLLGAIIGWLLEKHTMLKTSVQP